MRDASSDFEANDQDNFFVLSQIYIMFNFILILFQESRSRWFFSRLHRRTYAYALNVVTSRWIIAPPTRVEECISRFRCSLSRAIASGDPIAAVIGSPRRLNSWLVAHALMHLESSGAWCVQFAVRGRDCDLLINLKRDGATWLPSFASISRKSHVTADKSARGGASA